MEAAVRSVGRPIKRWLSEPTEPILRVSLRHLAFTSDVREIVANGIGRHLLGLARNERFSRRPLVLSVSMRPISSLTSGLGMGIRDILLMPLT